MLRKRTLSATLGLGFLLNAAGLAAQSNDGWKTHWACGQTLTPDKAVIDGLIRNKGLYGLQLGDKALPILLGEDAERLGTLIFARINNRWLMIPVAKGHRAQASYSTPSYNRFMLFSMFVLNEPGDEYRVLRVRNQFADLDCQTLRFPSELNHPVRAKEFVSLLDFNIERDGRGTLIGVAFLERGGQSTQRWYEYTTSNWGNSWSPPKRVHPPVKKPMGIFSVVEERMPNKALLDSLRQAAR